jgi:hypothetical protein
MIDPTGLMQRAKSIRRFIQDQAACREYKAERFRKLFELSDTHRAAGIGRPSNPGLPEPEILDVSEKAFQRAIFYQGATEIEFPTGVRKVEWLDFELPIVPGFKGRRRACDLIAKIQDGETTICEAKYRAQKASGSREPDYAIFELLFQLQSVALNANLSAGIHHCGDHFKVFSWMDIASAKTAMIVANRGWWSGKGHCDRARILRLVDDIRRIIGIEILLFQTEDILFTQPLDPRFRYKPKWPEGISTRWEPALKILSGRPHSRPKSGLS